jgi:hypothetical protein
MSKTRRARTPAAIGSLALLVAFATGGAAGQGGKPPAPPASFESVNVCERLPSEAVAGAVGGRALDAKPVNIKGFAPARCVYGIEIDKKRQAFVVWMNPADDFDGLRKAAEPPVTPLSGIGDQAYWTLDKETKRHWLTAVARGKVTIQVSGEKLDSLQSIARLALSKF